MKKLIIFCLCVLLLGAGLCVGGQSAGGEVYGSYYNGRIYSIRESLSDVENALRYRTWDDENGFHTGWFGHGPSVPAEGSSGGFGSAAPALTVHELDLELGRGQFRIVTGDEFTVSGGTTEKNILQGDQWELSVRGKLGDEHEVVITLPEGRYTDISIDVGAAGVLIEAPLVADDISFAIGAGSLEAALLDALDLDVEVGAGSMSALLAGPFSDYDLDAKASMGSISVNGEEIVGGLFGTHRAERGGVRDLSLTVGAGAIDLATEE